ncbi:MAG: PKD domain-containing protein, partial [Promethearchaeota archaeon]
PATFQWEFGDGSANSTLENPTHQYNASGNYTVTLTVNDTNGDVDVYSIVDMIEVVVNLVPIANFSANATTIEANNSIQFTFIGFAGDLPATYFWDFGDGSNSTERDPIHQYSSIGNYSVSLNVTDADLDSDLMIKTNYITVTAVDLIPVSNFSANNTVIGRGQWVQFNFTGTPGDLPATYFWDFGDGSNSTEQNPIHQFASIGSYNISLIVTDVDLDTDIMNKTSFIQVINLLPFANFTVNTTTIFEGENVQFNFTGVAGDHPVIFQWFFGDGSPISNDENPMHQYTTEGNYTVSLSILDSDFESDSITIPSLIIVLRDLHPAVNFSANYTTIIDGQSVHFYYTGSEGNGPATFQWDFGDGIGTSTQKDPIYVYPATGSYNVSLTVTDNDGDNDTLVINDFITVINDLAPVANFTMNLTTAYTGMAIKFNFTGFEGNPGAVFQWSFGDSSPNSTEPDPVHAYTVAGNYSVILTITDADGDSDSFTSPVLINIIQDLFPRAVFTTNATDIKAGTWIQFTFSGSEGNEPATFQWNFGDGSQNSSERNPIHEFSKEGTFQITLTVIDANGDVDTWVFSNITVTSKSAGAFPIMEIIQDYWYIFLAGVVGMVAVIGIVVQHRKKKIAPAEKVPFKQRKTIGVYSPPEEKLTHEQVIAKIHHFLVFFKETGTCIFYQPLKENVIDPQLIAGFLSAISSFGGHLDKEARLRVLEYQKFKILIEETEHCRFALLFQDDLDDKLDEMFKQFIFKFETTFGDELNRFKGEISPFSRATELIKDVFKISTLPDYAKTQAASHLSHQASGSNINNQAHPTPERQQAKGTSQFHLYCGQCKKWFAHDTSKPITGTETCPNCGQPLYFIPRCPNCGHSVVKYLKDFKKFLQSPDKCEKCGAKMFIQ